jgi:uncharacterized protein (TIGR00730 family)
MSTEKHSTIASRWLSSPAFWRGWWKVSRMEGPIVTIFGGKQAARTADDYQAAFECGKLLAAQQATLLTGGGPGIMEAAMCGFESFQGKKKRALGIAVSGIDVNFWPACHYDIIFTSSFGARKWLLIRYSDAFIIFPGGIGTMDELFETLNSIKFSIIRRVPVILVGVDYWKSIILWYQSACKTGYIRSDLIDLLSVTDSFSDAIEYALTANRAQKMR